MIVQRLLIPAPLRRVSYSVRSECTPSARRGPCSGPRVLSCRPVNRLRAPFAEGAIRANEWHGACNPDGMMLPLDAHSSPVHLKTRRALVVDDEPVVCESCRRILIGQGFQVETSTDSSTGLRLAELNEYDVILLDIRMPFIDGVRFLERLRQVRPVVPVIVITGHAADAYTRAAHRLGICECIAKPFTPAEIAQAVHRSLGHPCPSSDPSEAASTDAPDPPGRSRPSWQ
ncbi:MAG: hypothetical protein AMXMBFR13_06320 [Phycisphaerae bacterium]